LGERFFAGREFALRGLALEMGLATSTSAALRLDRTPALASRGARLTSGPTPFVSRAFGHRASALATRRSPLEARAPGIWSRVAVREARFAFVAGALGLGFRLLDFAADVGARRAPLAFGESFGRTNSGARTFLGTP